MANETKTLDKSLASSKSEPGKGGPTKSTNATKAKNKKPNWFRRVGAKFKETFSELKRVTWPTFPTVLKTTGVVLVIVLAFLAVVTGVDALLGWLLGLIS
ncbi:MAG: preprotein translocase subunit SecE [Clostridia bacterium]|nr:preprotein translocase subunit SecE [Clostridia bacterium]